MVWAKYSLFETSDPLGKQYLWSRCRGSQLLSDFRVRVGIPGWAPRKFLDPGVMGRCRSFFQSRRAVVYDGLVIVSMSSWGHAMSVYMVAA